ncbi:MAG: guanylate kinase [Acetatifactor sp.]
MGRIIYLMGKSSTGKDTIYKRLLKDMAPLLKKVVPYTTRPMRNGEQQGVEYFFTDEAGFQKLKAEGKVIEDREYHTMHGLWRYFTVDDGQIEPEENYIMIGTPEGYRKLQIYFGKEKMVSVLIELDDGIRLQRALNREKKQKNPKYGEMCRRFLSDSEDFAIEKLHEAGIERSFVNDDLESCLQEIKLYLAEKLSDM